MIGRTIGRYKIEAELGRGGTGVVWRAHHTLIGRPVALRTLHSELGASGIVRARVLEHQRLLQGLRSPAYVPVEDVIQGRRGLALVTQLLVEPSLEDVLQGGPLPLDLALSLGGELAHLLAEAHERGVVHGAIGPSKVRYSAGGGRLLDLGLGSAVLAARAHLVLRPHRTDPWRAPELVEGRPCTPRADVYSFGALVLHALSGAGPEGAGRDPGEVLDEAGVSAPAWLIGVLRRCLKANPDVRHPDLRPVLAAFEGQGFGPELPELSELGDLENEVTEVLSTSQVSALAPGAPMPRLRSPRKAAPDAPASVPKVKASRRTKAPVPTPQRRPEETLGIDPLPTEEEPRPVPLPQSVQPRRGASSRAFGAVRGMVAGLGVATVMAGLMASALACAVGGWFLWQQGQRPGLEGIAVEASLYVDNQTGAELEITCTQWAGERAGEPLEPVQIPAGEAGSVALSMLPADCEGLDPQGQKVLDWTAKDPYPPQGWALVAEAPEPEPEDTQADQQAADTGEGEEGGVDASASGSSASSAPRRTPRRSQPRRAPPPEPEVVEEAPVEMAQLTVRVESSKRKFQDQVDIYVDELRLGEMSVSTQVPVGQHNVRVARPGKGEAACVVHVPAEGLTVELDPASPRCP